MKSVVPDLQAMLAALHRKGRLASSVARERGWAPTGVSRLLVLPADRTARRRLERFEATLSSTLLARSHEVLRWVAKPGAPIHGVLFLTNATLGGARQRVSPGRKSSKRGPERSS